MKVQTDQIVRWNTGAPLDPAEINKVFLYASDAVDDVGERRYAKATITLPYVADMSAGYTNATAAEVRTFRFIAPVSCFLERCFLNANLVAGAAVTVVLTKSSDGSTPDGATVPLLSTGGAVASASVDTLDINVDRVNLVEGTAYSFTLTGTSFTTSRCDLVLHIVVDRWQLTSGGMDVPAFDPQLMTDASSPNANVVGANQSALTTAVNKFAVARGMVPSFFVRTNFNNASNSNTLQFSVPRSLTTRGLQRVVRLYVFANMATTGGSTVTAELRDAAAGVLATAVATVAGVTFAAGASSTLALTVNAASPSDITATTASDYSVRFVAGNAVNVVSAYAWLWTEWR